MWFSRSSRPRPVRRVAALGSSFASGPGLEPYDSFGAQRSERNYPHVLADRLGAELTDLTVAGATTATILREPQTTVFGETFAPQVQGLPEDADVVTVTAGGNDLEFIPSVRWAALSALDEVPAFLRTALADLPGRVVEPTAEAVAAAVAGLEEIVEAARARAPHARVVLVDYLTLVEPSGSAEPDDLPAEHRAGIVRIQGAIEEAFRTAAERSGADLVAVSDLSRGHALGAAEPWVTDLHLTPRGHAGSFHPTAAGMRAVGEEVARRLGA